MNLEQAKALRAAFPPESIGKLPRIWCKACSEAAKQFRTCGEHQKKKCDECGNNMTTAHLHLDYVGHAATSDRLLQVDPEWSWEPFALDERGLPAIDDAGNLWIKLTICGVTRPGVGDGKNMKERIGDALRNAAMRFGVALDLWAKEDLVGADPAGASTGTGVAKPAAKAKPAAASPTAAVSSNRAPVPQADEKPADGDAAADSFDAKARAAARTRCFAILDQLHKADIKPVDADTWNDWCKQQAKLLFDADSRATLTADQWQKIADRAATIQQRTDGKAAA